jgi:predicted dehydrogenase
MLRVGVVGTGLIATLKHLPAWKRAEKVAHVSAICDLDLARAREVTAKFGIPATYTSTTEMYAKERLNLIDVCTPPKTHTPLAIEALKNGAHVLLEKPMATSVAECDEIIVAANKANRFVSVAHSDLFYPSFMKAQQMVESGAIGKFRGMRIFLSTPIDYITSKPDHWAHKLPGGVLGETGPHVVYMTLAFIKQIRKIQIHAQKLLPEFPWSPYEDYRITLVGDYATSSIALIYTTKQWAAQVEMFGTDGLLRADLESQSLVHYRRDSLKATNVGLSALREAIGIVSTAAMAGVRLAARQHLTTHDILIHDFAKRVRDGISPAITPEEGRESIRVLDLLVAQLEKEGSRSSPAALSAS